MKTAVLGMKNAVFVAFFALFGAAFPTPLLHFRYALRI